MLDTGTGSAAGRELFINALRKKLGWPYVWGGESPAEGGYDCSGIVQASYSDIGITVPRQVTEQAQQAPYKITLQNPTLENIRRSIPRGYCIGTGYAEDGRFKHVGTYLGENRILHASSSKGKAVIDELGSYWSTNFRQAYAYV